MLPQNRLSKEEKKNYLLNKYVKRDKLKIEEFKKFGVFWRPKEKNIEKWKLISICDSKEEALEEIRWRMEYHQTNDGDLVLDNDKRFNTFRDETKNTNEFGETIEPEDKDLVDAQEINHSSSLMENLPASQSGFKSMAFYQNIELNYVGYYKIDEMYEIS